MIQKLENLTLCERDYVDLLGPLDQLARISPCAEMRIASFVAVAGLTSFQRLIDRGISAASAKRDDGLSVLLFEYSQLISAERTSR